MRLIRSALLGVIFIAFCWIGHAVWLTRKYDRGFETVARGDSEAVVRRLFGGPHEITGPPVNIAWGHDASLEKNGLIRLTLILHRGLEIQ